MDPQPEGRPTAARRGLGPVVRTTWTVAVLAALAGAWLGLPRIDPAADRVALTRSLVPTTTRAGVTVHVSGHVLRPGLVFLDGSPRVADAIEAAGGLLTDARIDDLNLAAPVVDGDRVVVPGPGSGSDSTGTGVGTGSDGLIDVNRAGVAELETLPGVGPVLAQRIVDHRKANGPFRTVEDLLSVSGIGERKLESLRSHIRVP